VDFIGGRVRFGERLMVSFHRTLRLPEDSSTYPLPPGLGLLQVIMQSETGVDKPNFLGRFIGARPLARLLCLSLEAECG